MSWHPTPKDDGWKLCHLAMVGKRVLLGGDWCQHVVRRIGEEFGVSKEVFVSHVRRTVLPSPVVSLDAGEIVWTIVVAGGNIAIPLAVLAGIVRP